jgi:putative endonuclease
MDHRSGKASGAKFTRRFDCIEIAYCVSCASKRQAQRIEWALKRLPRKDKLAIIGRQPDMEQLSALLLG